VLKFRWILATARLQSDVVDNVNIALLAPILRFLPASFFHFSLGKLGNYSVGEDMAEELLQSKINEIENLKKDLKSVEDAKKNLEGRRKHLQTELKDMENKLTEKENKIQGCKSINMADPKGVFG
jgi:hypothetical protein